MRDHYPEDYEKLSKEPGFLILRLLKPARLGSALRADRGAAAFAIPGTRQTHACRCESNAPPGRAASPMSGCRVEMAAWLPEGSRRGDGAVAET
jgi:hypothetical protein